MSNAKSRNPYREGSSYHAGFEFWQKQPGQRVTKSQLVKFYVGGGKVESAALSDAGVVLSPKEKDSERGEAGNCQGNYSAAGHIYFGMPSKKVKGEERSYQLRYRKVVLEKRVYDRSVKAVKSKEVKQVKAVKAPVVKAPVVKAPAKKAKTVKAVKAKTPVAVESDWTPAATPAPVVEAPAVTVEAPAVTVTVAE